jgi:hypothetical protein
VQSSPPYERTLQFNKSQRCTEIISIVMQTMALAACLMKCSGCSSRYEAPPAKLPSPLSDLREVVDIDVAEVGAKTPVSQQPPSLQAVALRANQKLRIRGRYAPVSNSDDVPVFANFYAVGARNPHVIAQSAVAHVMERSDDKFKFTVDIYSPTSDGGTFRVVLIAGSKRVLASGSVTIAP